MSWVETKQGGQPIKLCRRCSTEAPCCFSCRSFQTQQPTAGAGAGGAGARPGAGVAGGRFTDLPDGRVACSSCMATAVTSPQEAAALLSQVRHFFSSRHGFKSLAVDTGAVGTAEVERLSLSAAFDQINVSLMDRPVRRHIHPNSCGL